MLEIDPYRIGPGPETDRLIHTQVMGLTSAPCPAYTSDRREAQRVLTKLQSILRRRVISGKAKTGEAPWFARYETDPSDGTEVWAETWALAVCRLALVYTRQQAVLNQTDAAPALSSQARSANRFKGWFCAYAGCPEGEYERRVFQRCLYRHALPLALILAKFRPGFFKEDLEFIHEVATATTRAEVVGEINRFYGRNLRDSRWLRRLLGIRVSGKRMLTLWSQVTKAAGSTDTPAGPPKSVGEEGASPTYS